MILVENNLDFELVSKNEKAGFAAQPFTMVSDRNRIVSAKTQDKLYNPNLSETEYLLQQSNSGLYMERPSNYFSLPRSLTRSVIWQRLRPEYRIVAETILDYVLYEPCFYDDCGVKIKLEIGQICVPIRRIVEWCNNPKITKTIVERAIKKLIRVDFLRQEVRHKTLILTICEPDTYNLIKWNYETRSETKVRQKRDKSETEKNKENKEIKKTTTKKSGGGGGVFFCRIENKFKNITADQIERWEQLYPRVNISHEFRSMQDWLLDPAHSEYRGNGSFIRNWLTRASKSQPSKTVPLEEQGPDPEIVNMFNNIREQ